MPEARRDRWGRYFVVPPEGGKPIGYTRATTVAKSLDDGGGLIPWKATLAVTGLLRRPGLRGRFEALLSQHPEAGPWYGSAESKAASKKLIEECAEAGGSSDRADVGTALHAMVEQINTGVVPLVSQESTRADLDAYRRTIDAAGITFDPSLIEAMVVLDHYQVAGTADIGHAVVPGVGPVIADLKTGTDLKYSWQAISVQLAEYVNGDNIYRQGEAADGSQDRREPMPPISKELGLVIHLPAGEARCDLYLVDLVAGWEAFQHSMWARAWRTRKDLARPLEIAATAPASVAVPQSGPVPPPAPTAPPPLDDFDTPPSALPPALPAQRPGAHADAPAQVASVLSDFDTPPVSAAAPATAAVRPEPEPPQAPATPSTPTPRAQRDAMPKRPAEGDPTDPEDFNALQRRYEQLVGAPLDWVTRIMKEAFAAGVSFHAKEAKTARRFEIIRGLIMLAENDGADDEVMRALAALALGSDAPLFPAITAGHAVGALDVTAAKAFSGHVEDLVANRLRGFVGADELFRLQPAFS